MFQFFAKEKHPKPSIRGLKIVIIENSQFSPFSGKWNTEKQALNWLSINGQFFQKRGVTLILREND